MPRNGYNPVEMVVEDQEEGDPTPRKSKSHKSQLVEEVSLNFLELNSELASESPEKKGSLHAKIRKKLFRCLVSILRLFL